MLRQSLLNESKRDWHPPIPTEREIIAQVIEGKGRVGGSERLATKRVSVGLKFPCLPVFWLTRVSLFFRGKAHKLAKTLRGLK